MKIALSILILFILLSCNNRLRIEKQYIGNWESVDKIAPYKAILTINKDHTYFFDFGACKLRGFSKGNWEIVNDRIVLNSFETDSCYFISEFGVHCYKISDTSHFGKKTHSNCESNSDKYYVIFYQDKFEFRNDSLFHEEEINKACPDIKGMEDIFINRTKKN